MSENKKVVLCGANGYEQKYYLNPEFGKLPEAIRNELKIMCVLFAEEIGGIIMLVYREEGRLEFEVEAAEEDILFDDVGCGLKIKQMQTEKRELLESLLVYCKVFAA